MASKTDQLILKWYDSNVLKIKIKCFKHILWMQKKFLAYLDIVLNFKDKTKQKSLLR